MKRILAIVLFLSALVLSQTAGSFLFSQGQFQDIPLGLALAFTVVTLLLVSLKLFLNSTRRVSITLSQNQLLFISINAFLLAFAMLYEFYQLYLAVGVSGLSAPWQFWATAILLYGVLAVLFGEFATDCLRVRMTDAARTGRATFAWMPVRLDASAMTSQASVQKSMHDIRAYVLSLNKKSGKKRKRR